VGFLTNPHPARSSGREKMPGMMDASKERRFSSAWAVSTALPWVPELHRQSLGRRKRSDPNPLASS
jgi:hypothetical protein